MAMGFDTRKLDSIGKSAGLNSEAQSSKPNG